MSKTRTLEGRGEAGLTTLELVIGIVLMIIAVTIVLTVFTKANSSQALETSVSSALSLFDEARNMTLAAVEDSQYGVRIEADQLIRFRGASYSAAASDNVVVPLHSLVSTRNVTLAGATTSVIFRRLTGDTSQSGSFEIYLKDATTTYKRIIITATGLAEEN